MRLLLFVPLALTLGGCAGLGGSGAGPATVPIGNISNLPQVQLPGASVADARSVAMAAARTKGWDIVSADANRLLLQRPLPPDLPQAQALGSALAPPRMEVETLIVDRRDGAVVALQAVVITNPGTKDEKRIDYTDEYENQLQISLSSLSSAWIAARDKVHSQVPTLAERQAVQGTEAGADSLGDVAETVGAGGTTLAAADLPASDTAPTSASVRTPTPVPPPAPRAAPERAATAASAPAAPRATSRPLVAPTIEPPASPTTAAEAATPAQPRPGLSPSGGGPAPAPGAPTVPMESAGSNDMLVLNQGARKGLWSYYAEDYARLRGCKLGDRGATLMQQAGGVEVHEVECVGKANVLVKCRGGVCEPMR